MMTSPKSGHARDLYVGYFAVVICLSGYLLMTVSSSPIMRGAAFLWFPAAFQLIAGVWLGPVRGMIAGGIGAYSAGILAYGGWGPPDLIMNLVAGGLTNAWLPAVLFRGLRIDPSFGTTSGSLRTGTTKLIVLGGICVAVAVALQLFPLLSPPAGDSLVNVAIASFVKYIPSLLLLVSAPLWLGTLEIKRKNDFRKALAVVFACSFLSANLGIVGGIVSGKSWEASALGIGVGWFFGNSVASILGLYLLAYYTDRARAKGIAD